MLRSNRKNSPNHSNGSLPSYYINGHHDATSTTTNNGAATLRRRPKTASSSPSKLGRHLSSASLVPQRISNLLRWCCSSVCFWLLITTCTVCTYVIAQHGDHPQAPPAISHLHEAIHRTILEKVPPKFRFSNPHPHKAATPMLPPQPPRQGFYDVAVLGTGPAGLTAALFAARAGLSVLVLGSDGGSLLSETDRLENFPSFVLANNNNKGTQWLEQTKQQAAQWGANFAQAGLLVDKLEIQQQQQQESSLLTTFTMNLGSPQPLQVHSRTVIVATGATARRLGLPLEEELWGKSVHSCAICDGSSYVDRTVIVVGGGDAAVDGALLLSRYAKQVILVHRRTQLRASNQRNVELLRTTPNIRVEVPYVVQKLETFQAVMGGHQQKQKQEMLAAVDLRDVESGETQRIACDGVFELIGSTPNTQWLTNNAGPQMTSEGFLVLSQSSEAETRTATTTPGIFAAGEVTDQIYRQAITAAAEGAQAAMDAERWLRDRPLPAGLHASSSSASSPPLPLQNVLVPDDNIVAAIAKDDDLSSMMMMDKQKEQAAVAPCDDLTQQDCITKLVNLYPVVVFSKPWCPYCRKALEALAAEGLPEGSHNLHVVDLSTYGDKTRQIQSTLQAMTGRRTVPNVFVGGTSIGGGDETSKFHREGTLQSKLINARAIVPAGEGDAEQDNDGAPCDDLTQEACITSLVNQYPVVMFSKQGCPHCRRALEALALEGLPENSPKLHIVNLSFMANKQQIQDQLERMTGRRTVPNVFLGGSTIGGGSETVALQRTGDLHAMLEKVNAV
ncbi:34.2 kDa protein in rubredoxin operon [Seminavis robusta]|uniref:34.2 kDa protein in rubredoxin operon n=1 Tax=Seminavis robusta TaxID=568900 RepID=A0A9N8HJY7_9STRA|nr:34.2 kDa protein in rubredoxin operon [Seminavis robusta]|eukprot:Sro719_g192300.1 34.2 kDa protein in rubredoxin operon (788) ;mRNA; r:10243-12606